jgi:tetratricopeptide (TPR) repeat protein
MRVRGAVSSTLLVVGLAVASVGCNKNAVDAQKLARQAQSVQGETPKDAIEQYKQANQLDPSSHEILNHLALLQEKQKMWIDAADTWSKAAAADAQHGSDDFANYHFHRGYCFWQAALKEPGGLQSETAKGFLEKIKEPMLKAIQKDKNFADAWYYLGKSQEALDDEQAALESYTNAIQTRGDQLPYYVDLANLYLNLGYGDEGLQVAQEGQKQKDNVKPKTDAEREEAYTALYNLMIDEARAAELLNKADVKIAALEKTRSVPNPKNAAREAEFQLALAYYQAKRPNDACSALLAYEKTPVGKDPQSSANHTDATGKKAQWGCK